MLALQITLTVASFHCSPLDTIAGKSVILGNLSSVLFRCVHRGKSYLVFQVLDPYSWFYSILCSSSFKVHLKKHGLDPSLINIPKLVKVSMASLSEQPHPPDESREDRAVDILSEQGKQGGFEVGDSRLKDDELMAMISRSLKIEFRIPCCDTDLTNQEKYYPPADAM